MQSVTWKLQDKAHFSRDKIANQEMRANILQATRNAVKNAGSIVEGIVDISKTTEDWAEDSERIRSTPSI